MKLKSFLLISSISLVLFACNTDAKKGAAKMSEADYLKRIDSLEKVLYANPQGGIDRNAAGAMIYAYSETVKNYPSTKLAPDYLFKAGEIASSLNYSDQAIAFFKEAYDKYPEFKKAPYCLFLQAFIYENQLHQFGAAASLYKEVIKRYPEDRIAEDAKACLANLGKTDEELIKEFEEKNKAKS